LGAALARHCLDRGDLVTTCAQSPMSPLDAARHRHHVADVADPGACENLLNAVRSEMGYLDALVNNAGIAAMNALALTPPASIQRVMRVNVEGTMLMTRAAIRLLRRSRAGRIVNLTTVAVPLRLAGEATYAASKSAIETFTRVVAKEVGPLGITCNAVGPSPVKTRLTAGVPEHKLQQLVSAQAVPQWATPADVIHVIEFFLAPSSRMVTGQILYLGGAG
jgi:3-oxoacyl-[acyl-carrier protein] reductase